MKELNSDEVEQVSGAGFIADSLSSVGKKVGQWIGERLESLPCANLISGIFEKIFGGKSPEPDYSMPIPTAEPEPRP